jgi:hypothetical protein
MIRNRRHQRRPRHRADGALPVRATARFVSDNVYTSRYFAHTYLRTSRCLVRGIFAANPLRRSGGRVVAHNAILVSQKLSRTFARERRRSTEPV